MEIRDARYVVTKWNKNSLSFLAKEKMENYLALRLDEQDKALRDVAQELQLVQEKLGGQRFFFRC